MSRKDYPTNPLELFSLAGLSFLLMILLIVQYLPDALQSLDTQTWIEVPGTIVDSRVAEGFRAKDRYPVVRYEYEYQGETLEGDRIRFGGISSWDAERVVEVYPPDAEVTVFLDPADPRQSALEVGFVRDNLWGIPLLAFLGLAGVWLTWMGRRETRAANHRLQLTGDARDG